MAIDNRKKKEKNGILRDLAPLDFRGRVGVVVLLVVDAAALVTPMATIQRQLDRDFHTEVT